MSLPGLVVTRAKDYFLPVPYLQLAARLVLFPLIQQVYIAEPSRTISPI